MTETEQDLVQKAIGGDQSALAELLERHGGEVRSRLAGAIPKRWQSVLAMDDVMQQAYTDAFLGIGDFDPRGEGAFTAWLTTLARHNLLDAIKMFEAEKRGGGRRAIPTESPTAGRDESFVALYEWLGATSQTPSRDAARSEAKERLTEAIGRIPPIYQRVVRLYDLECRPVEEVAAELGRTPGAIYMLRARAHRMLAEKLGTVSQFLTVSA